jgi:hypothetical protein
VGNITGTCDPNPRLSAPRAGRDLPNFSRIRTVARAQHVRALLAWTQTSRNDCAQGQDRAALKVTVAGFGCGVYQVVKLYVHRDRRQDPLRRNGPHPHGRAGSSTAPAELPTKPWRPSEPLSVGRWAARAAGLDLRASRPRPHGCWRWWPPGRHGRTAGRLPAPLARRTGTPDRHRGAGGCGMWSSTSRRRAERPGTAGRKHDKNAVSQAFDTPSHAAV